MSNTFVKDSERNGEIEFLRFVLMIIIVNFHSWRLFGTPVLFPCGCLAVEFFFLLSGVLLAASVARKNETSPAPLSWEQINTENQLLFFRRCRALLPELFVSCLIACVVYYLCCSPSFIELYKRVVITQFGNGLFLKMSGMCNGGLNGASWYLSTLLMCTILLYPILRRWGNGLSYMVVGILLLSGLFLADPHFYLSPTVPVGVILKGNIRGMAEMMIGASLYPLVQSLRQGSPTPVGRILLTGVKWVCFLVFIAYSTKLFNLGLGLLMLALCVMLVLIFWEKCSDYHWYQHKFFLFLGRLSLPLFLSHSFYAMFLGSHMPDSWSIIGKLGVYNGISLLTALAVMAAARGIRALPPLIVFKNKD